MEKTMTEYFVIAEDANYVKIEEKDLDEGYSVDSLVYLGRRQYIIKEIAVANAHEGKIVFACKRLE